MKKIYVVGQVNAPCRGEHIMMDLLQNKRYQIVYLGKNFRKNGKKISLFFNNVLDIFYALMKIPFCDFVYILPMNNVNIEMMIAKLYRKKIVSEFYISLYDTFVNDNKTIDKNSFRAKLYKYFDFFIIDKSDRIIFLNNSEEKYYQNLVMSKNKKIEIVPLCAKERGVGELNFQNSRTQVPILCWWGTYIPLHGIDKIIEMALELKKMKFDYKLYIFGNEHKKFFEIKSRLKEIGLEKNVFIESTYTFNNGKLEDFLVKNCDLSLGVFGESKKSEVVLVNKIVDACSMNLPILTKYSSAFDEFFDKESGIICTENEPIIMAKKVVEIMCLKREYNTKKIYDTHFTIENYVLSINRIFNEIVAEE